MASLDLLYFGALRDAIGRDRERIDPPSHVLTIEDLVGWLKERGGAHADAFADSARIRGAVDQDWAAAGDSFFGAREVALFPPPGAL